MGSQSHVLHSLEKQMFFYEAIGYMYIFVSQKFVHIISLLATSAVLAQEPHAKVL